MRTCTYSSKHGSHISVVSEVPIGGALDVPFGRRRIRMIRIQNMDADPEIRKHTECSTLLAEIQDRILSKRRTKEA